MRASPAFPSTLVLVISLAWGLQETVAGPLLRASPLGLAGGSILTGLSFFYLAAAFLLVARVFPVTHRKPAAQAFTGAGAAVLAVLLFPTAGLVTDAPACTIPWTSVPASLTFGPVAVALAAAVPAGIRIGRTLEERAAAPRHASGLARCAAATAALQIVLTVAAPAQ